MHRTECLILAISSFSSFLGTSGIGGRTRRFSIRDMLKSIVSSCIAEAEFQIFQQFKLAYENNIL